MISKTSMIKEEMQEILKDIISLQKEFDILEKEFWRMQ
jgi:hypothetical protein